jgi:hypothetical protein
MSKQGGPIVSLHPQELWSGDFVGGILGAQHMHRDMFSPRITKMQPWRWMPKTPNLAPFLFVILSEEALGCVLVMSVLLTGRVCRALL